MDDGVKGGATTNRFFFIKLQDKVEIVWTHWAQRTRYTYCVCEWVCVCGSVGENQSSKQESDTTLIHFLSPLPFSCCLSHARTPWLHPISVTDTDRQRERKNVWNSVCVCVCVCAFCCCWQAHLLWLSDSDTQMYNNSTLQNILVSDLFVFTGDHISTWFNL